LKPLLAPIEVQEEATRGAERVATGKAGTLPVGFVEAISRHDVVGNDCGLAFFLFFQLSFAVPADGLCHLSGIAVHRCATQGTKRRR